MYASQVLRSIAPTRQSLGPPTSNVMLDQDVSIDQSHVSSTSTPLTAVELFAAGSVVFPPHCFQSARPNVPKTAKNKASTGPTKQDL